MIPGRSAAGTFLFLRSPDRDVHEETRCILLDGFHHGIEHVITRQLVLNYRITSAHGLETDTLSQLCHVVDVVHPLHINHLQQCHTLDLAHVTACLGDLLFLCLIELLGLIQQTLLKVFDLSVLLLLIGKTDGFQRNDGTKCIIQLPKIPFGRRYFIGSYLIYIEGYRIHYHLVYGLMHILAVQNLPALCIDHLTLIIIYLIVFQEVFTDRKVVGLDLLLCLFHETCNGLMLDLLSFRDPECIIDLHDTFGTEETHQIVLQ